MFSGKEYVYAVYKEKSFSAAAKKLYITQPALSNTIKRLEAKLGFPIFDRSTSPIQLTEEGQVYINTIIRLMEEEEKFKRFLDDRKGEVSGKLCIGGTSMLVTYTLPKLLSVYKKQYPLVSLSVSELNVEEGKEQLSQGKLDFLLANDPLSDHTFESVHFMTEHMFLAVPGEFEVNNNLKAYWQSLDNIISGRFQKKMYPEVSLEYFKELPFICLSQKNASFWSLMNACKEEGLTPQMILSMDQELSAYNLTCAGMGASFVSDTLICNTRNHSRVVHYKLKDEIARRELWIHYKKNRYRTKCINAFLELVHQQTDEPAQEEL